MFTVGDIEVFAGGRNRNGGWQKMNPPADLAAPETLLDAQADADASQLAAVASIEAAAESALQVTLAAEANNLVAAKNYTVAVAAKAV